MAPYLQEETTLPSHEINNIKSSSQIKPTKTLSYEPGRTTAETHENYAYDHLLPTFPDVKWDPLTEVPYSDKGLLGSPDFSSLLATATSIRDYNPKIGTEVSGIDLANLSDAQKNDIARLIATRGVVFFRNQKNFDVQKQRELGQYFGTLHRHATTSVPKQQGLEDVHVVFAEGARGARNHIFSPSFLWHSDVSCFQIRSWQDVVILTMGSSGYLRTPTSFIHKSKTPQRSPQRRRWYNTLVIPIRRLRCLVSSHANLPLLLVCLALSRHASRRLDPRKPASAKRPRHHCAPFDPRQSCDWLEECLFQSRICDKDHWSAEVGE